MKTHNFGACEIHRSLWSWLCRESWSDTARPGRCPHQFINTHLPHLHCLIPSVIDNVLVLSLRSDNDRVVPGPGHLSGNPLQDAWFTPLTGVRIPSCFEEITRRTDLLFHLPSLSRGSSASIFVDLTRQLQARTIVFMSAPASAVVNQFYPTDAMPNSHLDTIGF